MSERDSNPSSDDTGTAEPEPHKKTVNSVETTHSYFIPLVMLIVLSVIIVSTFYSKEFNNLITGTTPSDQADEHASAAAEKPLASPEALDRSEDIAESNTVAETASATNVSEEKTTADIETMAPGSTITIADTSSSDITAKQASTPELNSLVSTRDETSYPDRKKQAPDLYAPRGDYDMPRQQQMAFQDMMEQRRRSREEAMQARRAHMIKMHEYRAAVQKRIKQDRLDMHKRRQDTEHAYQRRLDERMDWMELQDKRSMKHPI